MVRRSEHVRKTRARGKPRLFLARFGSGMGSGLRLGLALRLRVGLGLRARLDPTIGSASYPRERARPLEDPSEVVVERIHHKAQWLIFQGYNG